MAQEQNPFAGSTEICPLRFSLLRLHDRRLKSRQLFQWLSLLFSVIKDFEGMSACPGNPSNAQTCYSNLWEKQQSLAGYPARSN